MVLIRIHPDLIRRFIAHWATHEKFPSYSVNQIEGVFLADKLPDNFEETLKAYKAEVRHYDNPHDVLPDITWKFYVITI